MVGGWEGEDFWGGGGGGGGLEGNIQLALPPPQRESGQAKPMRQADRTDIQANWSKAFRQSIVQTFELCVQIDLAS